MRSVKYAESKGVLLVQAAGQQSQDIDTLYNFLLPPYWMVRVFQLDYCGCKRTICRRDLVANFSNYGKKSVDVFAPGVKIYSACSRRQCLRDLQGTSMASPVVAGLGCIDHGILSCIERKTSEDGDWERRLQKVSMKVKDPGTRWRCELIWSEQDGWEL